MELQASVAAALAFFLLGCGGEEESAGLEWSEAERRALARLTPLGDVPEDPTNRFADDPDAAHLGQWLFFDPALSGNGEISCATCHEPELAFSDGKSVAEGVGMGTRRTPTLINTAYHRWFFWDGRADTLWSQALAPIENEIEMGGDRREVVRYLSDNEELRAAYENVFGPLPEDLDDEEAVDRAFVNVGKALAAYERKLVRGDSSFDRFAASVLGEGGDPEALSPSAQRGLKLFLGRGDCTLCHMGANFSDSEFHNTAAPPGEHGDEQDPGRYAGAALVSASPFNAAGIFSDDRNGKTARRVSRLRLSTESFGEFRTPSLRNLAGREPYMHSGPFEDLEAVLHFYSTLEGAIGRSHHQEAVLKPLELSEGETQDLLAFLRSLEGQPLDPALTRQPSAPTR